MAIRFWVLVLATAGVGYSQGKDMSDTTKQALFIEAVQAGDEEGVKRMLGEDSSLAGATNKQGVSAILLSLYYRQSGVTPLLQAVGLDLNVYEASAVGDTGAVEALLDSDTTLLDTPAPDGFTALGLAAFFGREETARALVKRGANVNFASSNSQKVAPLHSAAAGGHTAIAELLLENGADPNLRQEAGYVALHSAAMNGNLALVELLLRNGADPSIEGPDGVTATGLASKGGHAQIVELLN